MRRDRKKHRRTARAIHARQALRRVKEQERRAVAKHVRPQGDMMLTTPRNPATRAAFDIVYRALRDQVAQQATQGALTWLWFKFVTFPRQAEGYGVRVRLAGSRGGWSLVQTNEYTIVFDHRRLAAAADALDDGWRSNIARYATSTRRRR